MVLHGLKLRPSVVTGGELHIVKLIPIHSRGPQRPHLSGFYQLVQCLHGFLNRSFIVKAVDDVQIQVIRTQSFQRSVNLPADSRGRQPAGVKIDLRGNDHLITVNVLFQRPAQIFLAGSSRVTVGRIKEIDTQRKRVFYNFSGRRFIQSPVV